MMMIEREKITGANQVVRDGRGKRERELGGRRARRGYIGNDYVP